MALAGGLIALILGIVGIIVWWGHFIELLMGAVPVILLLGGALATYLGIEEIKDRRASESPETGAADLKGEVESLKEEIKELKGDKEAAEKKETAKKEEKKETKK